MKNDQINWNRFEINVGSYYKEYSESKDGNDNDKRRIEIRNFGMLFIRDVTVKCLSIS
ncbi:MAG: hypothetical protein KAW56_10785 [Candidatus Marinimicrobia bacterium]|nr:hypothetical protein [Candidatus Neomarinimicrobiota bacterium]